MRRSGLLLAALVVRVGASVAYEVGAVTNGGTIAGVVSYDGVPPPGRTLTVTKDQEVCGKDQADERLVRSSRRKCRFSSTSPKRSPSNATRTSG